MRRVFPLAVFSLLLMGGLWYLKREKPPVLEKGLSVGETLGGGEGTGFAGATSARRFVFPKDHGPHSGYRTEWWYFTGNLVTEQGRRFGYQLTFFRRSLTPHPVPRRSGWGAHEVYLAHFTLSDIDKERFRFAERLSRGAVGLAGAGGDPLLVHLENWSALESSSSPWGVKLKAWEREYAIDLDLKSLTPVILNGEEGLSRKGRERGNASYYYSLPRMSTSGSVRSGAETFRVTGFSWLDREWSTSSLEPGQVGWDWFALQLEDGRDLMFYRLRRKDGSSDPFSSGTMVRPDGSRSILRREDVELKVLSWWKSPKTGGRYPARWRLLVPAQRLDLEIVPRLADQELAATFRYWEGAVEVRPLSAASPAGTGYLEMTGYAEPKGRGAR